MAVHAGSLAWQAKNRRSSGGLTAIGSCRLLFLACVISGCMGDTLSGFDCIEFISVQKKE
jgi:hypothetical protein